MIRTCITKVDIYWSCYVDNSLLCIFVLVVSDSFSGESFLFTQDSIRFPFSSGTLLAGLGVVIDLDVIFRDFFWFTLFVLGVLMLTRGGRGEGGGGNCISSVFSLAHLTFRNLIHRRSAHIGVLLKDKGNILHFI